MKFDIKYQESYSRGELLLRTFLGLFYITIPHLFVLGILSIWLSVIMFVAFWSILITGKFPKGMFEFSVKFFRWQQRVSARLMNLADGYPKFGLDAEDEAVTFEMDYPENLSRGTLLLKVFFGIFYVLIPHGIMLALREIVVMIYMLIAWFTVLFGGKYPENMFRFNVETLRWSLRVNLYLMMMTDEYPPFSGKENIQPDELVSET